MMMEIYPAMENIDTQYALTTEVHEFKSWSCGEHDGLTSDECESEFCCFYFWLVTLLLNFDDDVLVFEQVSWEF